MTKGDAVPPRPSRPPGRAAEPDANALELLARIVAAGSFAQAARELGLTRAAVSRRVASIEALAGTPLFVRSTRSLALSAAGRRLAARAKAVAEAADAARRALRRQAGQGLEGSLRITTVPVFAQTVLAPLLEQFQQRHPALRLELRLTNRRIDLARDEVDVAFRYTARPPADWVAQPVLPVAVRAYAAPGPGRPLTAPPALATQRGLVFGTGLDQPLLRWRHDDGRQAEVVVEPAVLADDIGTLLALAAAGQGIVFAPDFAVWAALARGELVDVLPGWRLPIAEGDQVQALTLPTPDAPEAARALVRFVREALAPGS